MKDYLNKEDFFHLGKDLDPDGQGVMGVHCPSASGGKDEAMYVSKSSDGSVVAYCHRCGKSGCSKVSSDKLSIEQVIRNQVKFIGSDNEVVGEPFILPSTITYNQDEWPLEAISWVYKCGLTVEEVINNKIGYDTKSKRVIIPVTL